MIHAGMGKAGSSAVQAWLMSHGTALADVGAVLVGAVDIRDENGPTLRPYVHGGQGRANLSNLTRTLLRSKRAMLQFTSQLDRLASEHGRIIISGESLAALFWRRETGVLESLNELAQRHSVAVAYYVRPQHGSLEAGWRQWGFRSGVAPARYLRSRSNQLHYGETLAAATRAAPDVDLHMRPFRGDLLHRGDVVADFAHHFLDLEPDLTSLRTQANVGLPLVWVNVFAALPALWGTRADNRHMAALRELFEDVAVHDDAVDTGRRVLQRWAHRHFEEDNQRLLAATGWDVSDWLPDVDAPSDDLALIDELWAPRASEAELLLVERLLSQTFAMSDDLT